MTIQQNQPIPVEKGWPLLGILPSFLKGDPFEYLRNVMLEKGDFVQLNIGTYPVYLVSNPDYVKRILWENNHNYRKPDMLYNVAREVSGNGLTVSEGAYWLRQRRMIQPYLHRKALVYLFAEMTDAISGVVDHWAALAKSGETVELGSKMGEITMAVTVQTMFGKDVLPKEDVTKMGQRVVNIIKYIGESLATSMIPKWVPLPARRRFLQDLNATRDTINYIIAQCRQNKEISAGLINMLLNAVDEESQQQMTEPQLFDEVMTIFIAGYETTATVLTWLGVVIDKNPEVLTKLQAEIDQVLGGRAPAFEDVPRLIYTRQVFMEIMRMYTIVPFLPRALTEADQLGPYHLPAEAMVLVFYHGVHHNPQVWEQPEVFDPERFTPERISARHSFAYVPFSAGPRKCAGDEFALLEGPLIMAMILQKYNIHVLPGQTFSPKMGASMHPGNGVKVTFSNRVSTIN